MLHTEPPIARAQMHEPGIRDGGAQHAAEKLPQRRPSCERNCRIPGRRMCTGGEGRGVCKRGLAGDAREQQQGDMRDPPHAHMASRAITPPACHSSFLPTITMLRELSVPCASSHSTARRPGSAPRPHPHPRAATARPGGRAARPGGRAHAMAPTSTVSVVTNSPGLPKTMPRRQGRQRACTRGEGVTSLPPDLLQQIFVRLRPAGICAIARA